jgi:uncharacterized protein YcfL
MQKNTQQTNLLNTMSNELAEAFNNIPAETPIEIEYRLYYDENGMPVSMSSNMHPDGQYVIITKQQYNSANYNCRVIGGKLQFDLGNRVRVQLKKSTSGVAVVKGYAALVAETEYPEIEYYDRVS